MKKLGFTIVELMVVIAILGILSSVVVPKVAGVVVRAKASEISPAAMTYTKLQSAYLYENKSFGSWKKIGYQSPGGKKGRTDSFKYSKGDVSSSIKGKNLVSSLGGEGKVAADSRDRHKRKRNRISPGDRTVIDLYASLTSAPYKYAGLTPSSSGSAGTPGDPSVPGTPGDVVVPGGAPSNPGGSDPEVSTGSSSSVVQIADISGTNATKPDRS